MRRMIANAQVLERLAKEMVFNKETNTVEIGGNIEIDGNVKVNGINQLQNYYSGNATVGESTQVVLIKVMPLYYGIEEDNYFYGVVYLENEDYHFIGTGYWYEEGGEFDGLSDSNDSLMHVSFTKNSTAATMMSFLYPTILDKYYEHQLILKTQALNFYISYPSKSNLVVDSLQDLSKVVVPNANTRLNYGTGYIYYSSGVWKTSSGDNLIGVEDNVVVID